MLVEIRSVEHKALLRLLESNQTKGLPTNHISKIRRILTALITASSMETLNAFPGWRLHQLVGDREGTWSMNVTGNLRITFTVVEDEIFNLNLEDYH